MYISAKTAILAITHHWKAFEKQY